MEPTIRNYRPTDLEPIVALLNAADAVDRIEDGTSVEEAREWFSSPDLYPEENVFVAEQGARVVGYAYVRLVKDARESSFRTWYQVHPSIRERGLDETLLARQYARAEERLGECDSAEVNFYAQASIVEAHRIAILENFGLSEARRFWLMVRPSLDHLTAPQFPAGIVTRPYHVKEDDALILAALNEAFYDHWGHADLLPIQWHHYVSSAGFKHNLCVVAEDTATHEIAGVCTIIVNEEENARLGLRRGWIDDLAVRRQYRKRGLATALLLAGLKNLDDAGVQQAALGADSENLTGATRIYERAGFVVHRTRALYRKPMRGT